MAKVASKWIRNEADERAVHNGCRFREKLAVHVVDFFRKYLRHSKGRWAGKPFELLDWQREDIIYPLFGWVRADGTRRFRRAYVEIAKKNGKSTLASGIGLYMLIGDDEAGAEVYSLASDRAQASIVHGEAINMVEASDSLASALTINRTTHNIAYKDTNSWYRALSSEAESKEGLNIHCGIIDELHVWDHARELFDAVRYGGIARSQPLLFMITTAGVFNQQHVCWEEHEYAGKILDGTVEEDSYFAYIAAADKDDDWSSPDTWRKANPSFGITMDQAEFAESFRDARERPSKENSFRRYRLNQWVEQVSRWIQMEKWDACDTPIDERALLGQPCWAGLDLATTTDVAAFVLCFRDDDGGYVLKPWFWVPEVNAAKREKRDRVPYLQWARAGLVELTPGDVIDYAHIRKRINEAAQTYGLQEIAFDPYNATQLATQLQDEDGLTMIQHRQGFVSMNEPSKEFERAVLSGRVRHGGNPVLRWMVSNVSVRQDPAGNIKPDKEKSTEKIDGVVAAIMAVSRAMLRVVEPASVYEERGLVILD